MANPNVKTFFDSNTWTMTHVVSDPETKDAVVIDAVLDFDPLRISVSDDSNQKVLDYVKENGLTVHYVLDTHAHADHLSGFQFLKKELGAKIGIGEKVADVQGAFKKIFDLKDLKTDGSQWDVLIKDGVPLQAGSMTINPIATPGHTPACMTYSIGDALFTGDSMFMPDFGTGRCDFPGGSAEDLYDSMKKLYTSFPDETRVFVGHDYGTGGREILWETTIGDSKRDNIQMKAETTKEEFVAFRTARDAKLNPPKLIFQALQVNANAGVLPSPNADGKVFLKMPMGVF